MGVNVCSRYLTRINPACDHIICCYSRWAWQGCFCWVIIIIATVEYNTCLHLVHDIMSTCKIHLSYQLPAAYGGSHHWDVSRRRHKHRPVCPEELVALLEAIVEEHVDSSQSQLRIVDTLRLLLLQAARAWFRRLRHWDIRHRRWGTEGGRWREGGGARWCLVSLLPSQKESQPVAQFGVKAGECIFPARGQVQSNWGLTAQGSVGEPSVVPADESLLHIPPPHRCVWVLRDTLYVK